MDHRFYVVNNIPPRSNVPLCFLKICHFQTARNLDAYTVPETNTGTQPFQRRLVSRDEGVP